MDLYKKAGSIFGWAICLILFLFLFGCVTNTDLNSFTGQNNVGESIYTNVKEVKLDYVLDGQKWTLTTQVYGGLNEYLEGLPRTLSYYPDYESSPTDYDYIAKKLDNEHQHKGLESLTSLSKIQTGQMKRKLGGW